MGFFLGWSDYAIHLYDIPALNKDPILVATLRYAGTDFEADMAKAREDTETHRWWKMVSGVWIELEGGRGSSVRRRSVEADLVRFAFHPSSFSSTGRPLAEVVRSGGCGFSVRTWLVGERGGGVQDGELSENETNSGR